MPGSEREAVVANAKYLRNVRPVDPEEVAEYVEGRPHPAVVARHLRAEAASLGLVERADGTFAPVTEETLVSDFDGVSAFPETHARRFEDLLIESHGPEWHRGESGAALRETVRRLKDDYYRRNDVAYGREVALAYGCYHLPDTYAAAAHALHELGRDGLLDRHLRVLDVGAGVGGPALAVHDYAAGAGEALVEYDAVEPSAAADVLGDLLDETGPNFHATVAVETAEAYDPAGEYDVVLFANVWNELDAPAVVAARYFDALADDGTMLAVAPADRETSIGLRAVERELVDERGVATVYAPAPRFWAGRRPTDRGWSFDEKPPLDVAPFQRRLGEGAANPAEYHRTAVRYSWTALRTDGARRHERSLDRSRAAPLAEATDLVGERVTAVVAKFSHDLSEGGHPLFKVSDGSESVEVYAVCVEETALNDRLLAAGYGDPLTIENGLVLWNDDEGAVNVVVDDRAVVDRG